MLNIYEFAISLQLEQNGAMNLINPPWILVNVVNVTIEINVIPAGSQAISHLMHTNS